MLDTQIKHPQKEVSHHKDLVKDSEDSMTLVDRAQRIKQMVNRGEELELALINNFGKLSTLLELLSVNCILKHQF